MWQRIQSLYLFLAIVLNVALFFITLGKIDVAGVKIPFNLYGFTDSSAEVSYSTVMLAVVVTLSILLSAIVILSFKKRQLQIKLSQLNLFVQVGFVAEIFLLIDNAVSEMYASTIALVEYGIGSFMSLLPLLLIFLAIRSIKKDEALVRAADRIR